MATFSSSYDTYYDWAWQIPYQPHGPLHAFIGGYTNCGNFSTRLSKMGAHLSEHAIAKFAEMTVTFLKGMWRDFYIEAPMACSFDSPTEACHMVCSEKLDNKTFQNILLNNSAHYGWFSGTKDWEEYLPGRWYEDILELICQTPWSPGEQLEAGSPADISFWPIHPAVERLLTYKRIVNPFTSEEWKNTDGKTRVCISNSTTDCKGHHSTDLTSFDSYVQNAAGEFQKMQLTNGELFKMLEPNNYMLSYVYDNFDWEYCSEEGYHFPPV